MTDASGSTTHSADVASSEYNTTILTNAEAVFRTLRLSNIEEFNDVVPSPWVFRGQSSLSHRLVPQTWRPNFLKAYPPQPILDALVKEGCQVPQGSTEWQVSVHSPVELQRLEEAVMRVLIEQLLLINFAVLQEAVELGPVGPRQNARELTREYSLLLDSPIRGIWPIAQHYGLPTRLLDWSRDPLTAVFFALHDSEEQEEIVGAVDITDYRRWDPFADLQFFQPSRSSDRRIGSQSGLFSFAYKAELVYVRTGVYPSVAELLPCHKVKKYILRLDAFERSKALKLLFLERRTKAHLMPDNQTCAEVAKQYYRSDIRL